MNTNLKNETTVDKKRTIRYSPFLFYKTNYTSSEVSTSSEKSFSSVSSPESLVPPL